jgi:hypothetical protein
MDSFASPEKFKSSDSLNLEYNMGDLDKINPNLKLF